MSIFSRGDESERSLGILQSLKSVESSRNFKWPLLIVGGLVLVGSVLFFLLSDDSDITSFRTVKAKKSDLTVVVTATGTLSPVKEVIVGTEISGVVQQVLVDENDRVKKGQTLARLNTERFEAEYSQSFSSVSSAEAGLVEARATLTEARENLKKLEELHKLSGGLTPSAQELQAAKATMSRAVAKENSAKASIKEAKARLSVTEINLKKSVIRSPINGIVLKRTIEPGQTVAASFSTPELFIIAENLTQLVLRAEVDEADIGRVKTGQPATFSVDAFPDRSFDAKIIRVRFAPTTTTSTQEAVVTYETTLSVSNNDLSLRPGMTATAEIIVEKLADALVVPNAALRFEPPVEPPKRGFLQSLMPGRPPRVRPPAAEKGLRRIYILKENVPVAVSVETSATDGAFTAITKGNLKPGDDVIIEMMQGVQGSNNQKSPQSQERKK